MNHMIYTPSQATDRPCRMELSLTLRPMPYASSTILTLSRSLDALYSAIRMKHSRISLYTIHGFPIKNGLV
jgi:hypothetical protein